MSKRRIKLVVKKENLTNVLKELEQPKDEVLNLLLSFEESKTAYKVLSSDLVVDWDFAETEEEVPITEQPIFVSLPKEETKPVIEEKKSTKKEKKVENEGKVIVTTDNIKVVPEEEVEKEEVVTKPVEEPEPVKAETKKPKATTEEKKEEVVVEAEEEEVSKEVSTSRIKVKSLRDLVRFIESAWYTAKKFPNIRFNTDLFYTSVGKEYDILKEEEAGIIAEGLSTLSDKTSRAVSIILLGVYYNISANMRTEVPEHVYKDTLEKIGEQYNSLKSVDTLNQVMNLLYRYEEKQR